MAAQLTATNGPLGARALLVDVAREELLAGAALAEDEHRAPGWARPASRRRATRRSAGELPTISRVREQLDLVLQRAVLGDERWRSAALRTLFTIVMRLSGFSTKSYAPSRIA